MKKLLVIIGILLLILVGMFVYKRNINNKNVSSLEVGKIEEYIEKIYLWQEITGDALPKFKNINEAPDIWVWEVVKQSFEKYELTYEQIQERAKEIFGDIFKKQFPKEGTDFIYYSESSGKYQTSGMGLDTEEDEFFIKKINKTNRGYQVEIVEYLVDHEESMLAYSGESNSAEIEYDIYIKNLKQDIIATLKNTDNEEKIIEVVKENLDKFSTKKINLIKVEENLYVESVE